jgi:hypothetical protein
MHSNSLGNRARGVSNSIASPGISQLFGGGSTTTAKPQTAVSTVATGAGVQPAPIRPQTQEKAMTRYTPTYVSNAFAHTQYEAPLKNTESAATRTLNSTGTSIEDYGRRNQKFDKNAFMQAAGKPGIADLYKMQVIKKDDPNCTNCCNHEIVEHKKTALKLDKLAMMSIEQRRAAEARAQEQKEIERKRAEFEANKHEMSLTLSQIESNKRAQWEAKKNDRTNLEQTEKLNTEIQKLTQQSVMEKVRLQQSYKDELNRKREEAIQANVNGKITDRELERRLKGLTFECYERDQKMKEETKNTGSYVRSQISHEQQRKQQEKEQMVQPPEVFYTDKELAELRAQAEANERDVRAHNASYAKDQLTQHITRVQGSQSEKQRTIAEEREHQNKLRQIEQNEKEYRRRTREERQSEMNHTLSTLERQKRAEWEAKKNDQTNKYQTEALHNEISALTHSNLEEKKNITKSYYQDLSTLTSMQRAQLEQERQSAKESEARAKGLTFECYKRDPIMKELTRETGGYQKTQTELGSLKKRQEREHMIMPPESLVTTEHLQAMQSEAIEQDMQKRDMLKSLMKNQYVETQAQKQARLEAERKWDAEEASRAAAKNAHLTKIEREINEANKKGYNQYLAHQVSETEQRKQFEVAERKYDPNVERLIEENQMIGERIVKCGKCNGTLAHERTIINENGHSH